MPTAVAGICWSGAGTVGLITPSSPLIRGRFPSHSGSDATVLCELVDAGKFRNGAARSWCRTHQHYWGTKADLANLADSGSAQCRRHADPMSYVLAPLVLAMPEHGAVHISLKGDQLLLSLDGGPALPHPALAIAWGRDHGLFAAKEIVQVNLTPPAVAALSATADCVCCSRCGHPHLDLGEFASRPHKRHYCGFCGHDGTHSGAPMISNPLAALVRHYAGRLQFSSAIVQGDCVL